MNRLIFELASFPFCQRARIPWDGLPPPQRIFSALFAQRKPSNQRAMLRISALPVSVASIP